MRNHIEDKSRWGQSLRQNQGKNVQIVQKCFKLAAMDGAQRLKTRLSVYGESHQNPLNRKIHKICVPLIMLSFVGLLQSIPGSVHWDWVVIGIALVYYSQFRSPKVYAVILAQLIPMLIFLSFLGREKVWVSVGIFAVAWIGQFIGHKIEGKKPSFFEDLQYLLIGPIWILS